MKPLAKTNLLFEELADETLVYDVDRHRVHSLNPVAAFLLRNAEGTRTIRDLADAYEKASGHLFRTSWWNLESSVCTGPASSTREPQVKSKESPKRPDRGGMSSVSWRSWDWPFPP